VASTLKVQVQGLRQLAKSLNQFSSELKKKPLQVAVGRAAREVRDEVRRRAPQGSYMNRSANAPDPGRIYNNIIAAKRKRPGGADMEYIVMVRGKGHSGGKKGKTRDPKNAWYWFMLEFGTAKQAAQPFMRPGFESKKQAALSTMTKYLAKGIQSVARKLAKADKLLNKGKKK